MLRSSHTGRGVFQAGTGRLATLLLGGGKPTCKALLSNNEYSELGCRAEHELVASHRNAMTARCLDTLHPSTACVSVSGSKIFSHCMRQRAGG